MITDSLPWIASFPPGTDWLLGFMCTTVRGESDRQGRSEEAAGERVSTLLHEWQPILR